MVQSNMQEQIDDLLTQQAQQLSQLSSLQNQLAEKDLMMKSLTDKHNQEVTSLRSENSNLQQDLVRAYKQKKQEVCLVFILPVITSLLK